ncbi:MAG: hypothetical protein JNL01_01315 [Bdellovibrionales bacterium]|nr:hypothetical protein [Bdellovibrionales bacterium]
MSIALQIDAVRSELSFALQKEDLTQVGQSLESLALIAESHGQRDLCLKAQATREMIGQGRDQNHLGESIHEIFNQMAHFAWKAQSQSSL